MESKQPTAWIRVTRDPEAVFKADEEIEGWEALLASGAITEAEAIELATQAYMETIRIEIGP